eukprot:gene11229-18858_t
MAIVCNKLQESFYSSESFYSLVTSSTEIDAASACTAINNGLPDLQLDQLEDGRISFKKLSKEDPMMVGDSFHQILVTTAAKAVAAGHPLMQISANGTAGPPILPRLLAAVRTLGSMSLVDKEKVVSGNVNVVRIVDEGMVHRFVEDLLDMGTLEDCKDLFAYIEEQHLQFKGDIPTTIKLPLMRACNSLLKRLSKAQDNQMCGRILIFMAKLYPLADKSGVNLHGNINMSLPLPVDEVEEDAVDSCGQPIDVKVYTTLWNLQNVFKVEEDAVDSCGQPIDLKVYTTLWNLQNVFKDPVQVPNPTVWSKNPVQVANPTVWSKNPVQVANPTVWTQNPVQVANPTVWSKVKSDILAILDEFSKLPMTVVAGHSFAEPNKDRRKSVAGDSMDVDGDLMIYEALVKTEEKGADFAIAVRSLLERESVWVAWKNQSCPPFEREPESVADSSTEAPTASLTGMKRRRGANGPTAAAVSRQHYLRMVTTPEDQMSGLKTSERKLLPTLKDFLQPVIQDMDPESCIDEAYRRIIVNKVFAWKCSRLISRSHLDHFSACKDDIEKAVVEIYPELKAQFEAYRAQREAELKAFAEQEAKEAAGAAATEEAAGAKGGDEALTLPQHLTNSLVHPKDTCMFRRQKRLLVQPLQKMRQEPRVEAQEAAEAAAGDAAAAKGVATAEAPHPGCVAELLAFRNCVSSAAWGKRTARTFEYASVAAVSPTAERSNTWISRVIPPLLSMVCSLLYKKNDTHLIVLDTERLDEKPYTRIRQYSVIPVVDVDSELKIEGLGLKCSLALHDNKLRYQEKYGSGNGMYGLVLLTCRNKDRQYRESQARSKHARCQLLIKKAGMVQDPVAELPEWQTYNSNNKKSANAKPDATPQAHPFPMTLGPCAGTGRRFIVSHYTARTLPPHLKEWTFDLVKTNMRPLYEQEWTFDLVKTSMRPLYEQEWTFDLVKTNTRPLYEQEWTFDLVKANMRPLDRQVWGWSDSKKKVQLEAVASRFILASEVCEESGGNETEEGKEASAPPQPKPVAYINYRLVEYEGLPSLYVYEAMVEPTAQQVGLGTFLMRAAENMAWHLGMDQCVLTEFTENKLAVTFYRKLGYVLDKTSPKSTTKSGYEILSKRKPRSS